MPALPYINKETFKEILKGRLENNPLIVVFAEQNVSVLELLLSWYRNYYPLQLSPEDFKEDAAGQKPFKPLTDIKTFGQSTYLPFVENPISVINDLFADITQVSYKSLLDDPSISISSQVVLLDFNDAKDGETRQDMLRRHGKTYLVLNIILSIIV